MADDRKLSYFLRRLGLHELAGASVSHGDIVAFTEGVRPGIVIADTIGRRNERGDAYRAFLEEQITDGWGKMGVIEEMRSLERRVLAKIKAEGSTDEANVTYGMTALGFAQFEGHVISYSGTGLDFPWILRENGGVEEIILMLPKFKKNELPFRARPVCDSFSLRADDVLLLKSGGLIRNMRLYFDVRVRAYAEDHGITGDYQSCGTLPPKLAKTLGQGHVDSLILDTIRKYQTKPAAKIRDGIVKELGEYFLPLHDRYDDITFAIAKRCV